jgi:hypothetical protein
MNREDIIAKVHSVLSGMYPLKRVTREPIIPEELAKSAFPAAYIETANEEIEDLTGNLRSSTIEVNIILFVSGIGRDSQRNNITAAIESALMTDRTLDGNVRDIALTNIETVTIGEASPYASYKLVFECEYCYTI